MSTFFLAENSAGALPANPLKADSVPAVVYKPLFVQHQLKVQKEIAPRERSERVEPWVLPVLIFSFIVFVIIRVLSPRKLARIVQGLFNTRAVGQLAREEQGSTERIGFVLTILFLLNLGLFFYLSCNYFIVKVPINLGIATFLIISAALGFLYAIKYVLVRFSGILLDISMAVSEYNLQVQVMNNNLGLILIPLNFCIAFETGIAPYDFVYVGILFLSILFIFSMLRIFWQGLITKGFSPVYLFLYLCVLEILPLIVLIKVFVI